MGVRISPSAPTPPSARQTHGRDTDTSPAEFPRLAAVLRNSLRAGCIDFLPGLIGIEPRHALGQRRRVVTQILLVDGAGMIHEERHHARIAVFRGKSEQRKSPDHLAPDDVIEHATGRVRPLPRQDAIVVAVVGRTSRTGLVSLFGCLGDEFAERTRIAIRRRPIEAVLLAGGTDDAPRIDAGAGTGAILLRIFVLRIDIGKAGLNRVEFVAPNAPVQDLKPAGGRIERPVRFPADERNREREVVGSHDQESLVAFHVHIVLGIVGTHEPFAGFAVCDFIT